MTSRDWEADEAIIAKAKEDIAVDDGYWNAKYASFGSEAIVRWPLALADRKRLSAENADLRKQVAELKADNRKLSYLVDVLTESPTTQEEIDAKLDAVDAPPLSNEKVERILHNVWKRIEEAEAKESTP